MVGWSRRAIWGSALAVGVFQLVGSYGAAANQPDRRGVDAFAILLLVVGPVALAVRDRWPIVAVAVTVGALDVWVGRGYAYGPIFVSAILAIVAAVVMGHRRTVWIVVTIGYVGFVTAAAVDPYGDGSVLGPAVIVAGWALLVLAIAEVARNRREQVLQRRHAVEVERERRLDEQRLELAQELHDVLAHTISLINVQASVALHLLGEQPERARPALAEIKAQSSEALRELRTALDVLRRGDAAPRTPAPRLIELPDLVETVRASGLDVRLVHEGVPAPLPSATELAAYRIVQEALTNVTRHAHAHSVEVVVRHDGGVHLEIVDDGIGDADRTAISAALPGGGSGIIGMRERAESVGGTLTAGPDHRGGFRVEAHLPAAPASAPARSEATP
jgi:signal transduction histidine kinase